MPTAIPYNPDGTQPLTGPGARKPYTRKSERRALLSALKAWWTKKGIPQRPPEGAVVHMDGVPAYRYERVPVIDPATDEVVSAPLQWVDIRVRAVEAEEAAALEAARKAYAARKAERAKLAKKGAE